MASSREPLNDSRLCVVPASSVTAIAVLCHVASTGANSTSGKIGTATVLVMMMVFCYSMTQSHTPIWKSPTFFHTP